MARTLRITYPGAWYHIMNFGVNQQAIFFMDAHRKMFLNILHEISEKYNVQIHAYCLMSNHYHLMVHTPCANISRVIHHLDTVYAIRFNKLLGREGAVFRGRFQSVLVQNDAHLLHLSRYIHLKPVLASMVDKAQYYQWSSYQAYIEERPAPRWLHTEFLLCNASVSGAECYQSFVEQNHDVNLDEFYQRKPVAPILGSDEFKIEAMKKVKAHDDLLEIPQKCLFQQTFELQTILEIIMKISGETRVKIFTPTRGRRNDERLIFMYLAREKCRYKLNEIKSFMGLKCKTTITMGVKRINVFMTEDSLLKAQVELCLSELLIRDTTGKEGGRSMRKRAIAVTKIFSAE